MLTREEMKKIVHLPFQDRLYTKEMKTKWWGEGEWVDELDYATFMHEGILCRVIRVACQEPHAKEEHFFGGHLCGYCMIPKDHPEYKKGEELFDFDYDVHGGITHNCIEEDGEHWIGFDCAHSTDYLPSMEALRKKLPSFKEEMEKIFPIPEKFKDFAIFNPSYKNWSFAIGETKSLAEQIKNKMGA